MLDNRNFWIAACTLIAGVYVVAAVFALQFGFSHRIVRLALLMLAVHVLELPLAFKRLAPQSPDAARLVPLTLLFGAAWWLPAQRKIFRAA